MKKPLSTLLLSGSGLLLLLATGSLHAQSENNVRAPAASVAADPSPPTNDFRLPTLRQSANIDERTIGVAYAHNPRIDRAILALDEQLASQQSFRIVPVVQDNQLQSLFDLTFLKGIDAAVINSDVVAFAANRAGYDEVLNSVGSLAGLGGDTLTFLARQDITSIEELEDKIIAIDAHSAENQLTTSLIVSTLGIDAKFVQLPSENISRQLRSGNVDATLVTLRTAETGSQHLNAAETNLNIPIDTNGLRALNIPKNKSLQDIYNRVTLTHEQLPNLIKPDTTLSTVRRDRVLAAYRWKQPSVRLDNMIRLAGSLVEGSTHLASLDGDNLWTNLNFNQEIPGVPRLEYLDTVVEIIQSRQLAEQQARELRMFESFAQQIDIQRTAILSTLEAICDRGNIRELDHLIDELESFTALLEQ